VNVGIILAMAGMDYRHVVEPDYDPQKIRQSAATARDVKTVVKRALECWRNRDVLKSKIFNGEAFYERSRNIYYDTDNIQEKQIETIKDCPDCSGAIKLESTSDRGRRILGVHIPRKACPACSDLGYQWYEAADMSHLDLALMQDRPNDEYALRSRNG
jgi:hypothetical protein